MRCSVAFALALVQLCVAGPLSKRWDNLLEKHSWVEVPNGWEFEGPAPADELMHIKLGMKQSNLDGLIEALYEVSDPSHDRYGQHLSQEEINELVAPHPESLDLVDEWLAHHDIPTSSIVHKTGASDYITLRISVAEAERMLGASYAVYRHTTTGESIVRTLGYSLPAPLHGHVDVVVPTTYFGTMRSMKATSFVKTSAPIIDNDFDLQESVESLGSLATVPSSCARTITPACLQALYNTAGYTPTATATNKLGLLGYLEEFANFADLQTFYKKFLTKAVGNNFTTVLVNGGLETQSDPGVEANLDIQYGEGMSFPTPNIFYSVGGSPPFIPDSNTPTNTNEPYLDFLNFILNQTTIPQTFSTSYGDDEQTVPLDYATNVCNLFAQLGARGVSIMFSSGDDGVGGGNCESNNGTKAVVFQPNFPASCPFVTTVGATTGTTETAVSFSAGGFSNYFAQPSYQTAAVSKFLTGFGTTKFAGLFNRTSRAYPDVAAQGENFQVIIGGSTESVAGTSCSSPTFAGVVALLNDFRISNGKAPLGFLNPLFYGTASTGFNDITSGSNPGCGTAGFTAVAGWDPVTGLGTPNFTKLQTFI